MLEIRKINLKMEENLIKFFSEIPKDYIKYYTPYDFTPESARNIANYTGKDLHYVLIDNKKILGHGMLRGWDEGYDTPSLGIIIHPNYSNNGLGSMFVRFLHSVAWLKGCTKIRLSVYKDNTSAIKIYKKFGYKFIPKNKTELIGTLYHDTTI